MLPVSYFIKVSARFIALAVALLTTTLSAIAGTPSVSVSATAGPVNTSTISFTITFSEGVSGFNDNASDFIINSTTGGTLTGAISPVNASTYTVIVSGMAAPNGNITLTIPAGAATSVSTGDANSADATGATIAWDGTAPTVSIDQGVGQPDPTTSNTVIFTAVFSEAVVNFTNSDITLSGSAGATTASVSTLDNITWNITVSGMVTDGTVLASIAANVAEDAAGNGNTVSSSSDNTVFYDGSIPSVTINKEASQSDPTNASPIVFTVTFSEAVTGFTNADISLSGSAGATTASVITSDNITYTVSVTGMTNSGSVVASIAAGAAQDAGGNNNTASTSVDNSVAYDDTVPTVTIFNPAHNATSASTDPTLVITFNENIAISTTGSISGTEDRIQIKRLDNDNVVVDMPRNSGSISISGNQVSINSPGPSLALNTDYYVTIGSKVFSDFSLNDFAGFSTNSTWSFRTSAGATVNNLAGVHCTNNFATIGDIIITETATNNIQGAISSSRTLTLGFDAPGFIFDPSSIPNISVNSGADIVNATSNSPTYSSIQITFNFEGINATDELDIITISGIKVAYDGTSTTPVHIVRTGGSLNIQGISGSTHLATLSSATQSATPTLVTPDVSYCQNENLAATMVQVSGAAGATFKWYSNASLTSLLTTGNNINVTSLGISTASATTYTRYVTQTEASSCESAALAVVFTVSPRPEADAGADQTIANGNTEVCTGASISLGGSPTLKTASSPGAYTYTWTSTPAMPIPSVPNPQVSVTNNTITTISYQFTVNITDANGCSHADTKVVDVKIAPTLQLTQPTSTTLSTNTSPQLLTANIAGGVFSGVGVIQTGPSTYKFDASAAYDNTQPLPQSYTIYYSVNANGCTITNYPIATMYLSNQLFSTLASRYCSDEYPVFKNLTTGVVRLSADLNAYNSVMISVDNWNNYTRFYYAPFNTYPVWAAGSAYPINTKVRHGNEIYVSKFLNIGMQPNTNPSAWQLSTEGKVQFNGTIRNYYEGIYGGNAGGPTIVPQSYTYSVSGKTFNYYEMLTNTNYVDCSTCNSNYPAFYMDFINPSDIRYFTAWNSGYYYYPGDVVSFGGTYYKCILTYNDFPFYSNNQQPNSFPAIWQAVSSFDNGSQFAEAGKSGVFARGQFVSINKTPSVFFNGLASGLVVDAEFCNINQNYNLTGNLSAGIYRIDLGSGFVNASGTNGLESNPNGQGVFNPSNVFTFLSNPSTAQTIRISYTVDGGALGSTGQACTGTQIQTIKVNPLPAIALNAADNPDPNVQLCYNGSSITLTSAPADGNVTFSGYGILDNANGTATLNPKTSFDVSVFQTGTAATTNQPIAVTAKYRNPLNGCTKSTPALTYTVKPISPASFDYGSRTTYCYEDQPQALTGGQASAYYDIAYDGASAPYTLHVPQKDYIFNPKFMFVDAVSNHGADPTLAQQFTLTYTATVSGCENVFIVKFTVNPKTILDIPVITADQIVCSSSIAPASIKVSGNITGSGSFSVSADGITYGTPGYLNNNITGSAVINLNQAYAALPGTSGYKDLYVRYTQTSAGCTGSGSVEKRIRVSDPPSIAFSGTPADAQFFCRDAGAISLTTLSSSNQGPEVITLTGPGVTDLGNGSGSFDPNSAMTSLESANNTTYVYATRPTTYVTAFITDANQCVNSITKPLIINPIPTASVANYPANLCYTGSTVTIDGQQPNAYYTIVYNDITRTDVFGSTSSPVPDLQFNPKTFFDNAVAGGANSLSTLTFDVHYTSFDPDLCLNQLPAVTIKVAPEIIPTIAGIDDQEEYCSTSSTNGNPNASNTKVITLTPSSGNLFISTNGGADVQTPFNILNNAGVYQFSTNLNGGTYRFTYNYISGNNCLNTTSKTVYVLPSPVAQFTVTPKCEQDIIDYNANPSQNTAAASYTWTFDNATSVNAQNAQHQFTGTGTFDVELSVEYPATGVNNIVCSSQLLQKQTIGQIPNVDFNFSNVCENDNTQFNYNSSIPISSIQWDFGDGAANITNFGAPNQPVQVSNGNTTGTNGSPLHTFSTPGSFTVTLTGRTASINGACADTQTKEITILNYLKSLSPSNPYVMKALNGEDGFWVKEDNKGNSTWEFNSPTGNVIAAAEKAWVTNANGVYKSNDNSYVNSPCFDLTDFARPVISLQYWADTPLSDGAVLQYSIDGGVTWPTVGNIINGFSSGQNWFNALGISSGPGGQSNYGWSTRGMESWTLGKHSLDVVPQGSRDKVRFRIAFGSISSLNEPTYEGFAFQDVKIEERNRTVLVENFINASIPTAQANRTAFQSFKNDLSDLEIVKIQYHTSFPGEDNISNQNLVDPSARAAFYGVTQPPKAFVDGFSNGHITESWAEQFFSIRSLDPSPLQLDFILPVTPDADKLSGKLKITSQEALEEGIYTVQICVIERLVNAEDYVLRKMLPSASGTALPAMSVSEIFEIDFQWELDRNIIIDPSRVEVVAFVQQLQGDKKVLQSALLKNLPPINLVTDVEKVTTRGVHFYPTPADESITVLLSEKSKTTIDVMIIDAFGRAVYNSAIPKGEDKKQLNTDGLASGVYIIQLNTVNGMLRKKVIVAHKH